MTQHPDEIDVVQLLKQLWNSKITIVAITALFMVAAAVYLAVVKPTYQSQAVLVPATPAAIQSYRLVVRMADPNILISEENAKQKEILVKSLLSDINVDGAYSAFQRTLTSQSLKQDFFVNNYLSHYRANATALEQERLFARFTEQLNINLPRKPEEFETIITLKLEDPALSARWLNKYIEQALVLSQAELLNNLKVQRDEQIRAIESRIAVLRTQAKIENDNQISRVRDALSIADSIQLEQSPSSGNLITSYTGETMYLRGSNALKAELNILEGRQNFDPYIDDLPLLQRQLDNILLTVIPGPEFKTAVVDQAAMVPFAPTAPKKHWYWPWRWCWASWPPVCWCF
ncbi:Wzz/FepE/Etk N-terminal domain-containing protein [Paenalcaligenes niemegkensis]|uniref:Wzz/FepE/Etk N-terminal domain-containing protein n=1 Tax=Paenalcaligenes niemegkensis TaxID=2895469 RepID=UPI001EE9228F|nr:Wzz/FepE/Etk N-terminal domain-containing protein [Paenalcaligenes niemegkensis]MCQ9618297.1 Wzz/FepE/Etk N-terminal domain-containing protein [Paenalcaligenes niemegkensis]